MVLVIVLTSSIVAIAYLCILPLILQTYSVPRLCWHFFYSHWNLILIVFHYYQAITTPPGYPPAVGTPSGAWGRERTAGYWSQFQECGGRVPWYFGGTKPVLPQLSWCFSPSAQGRNDITTVSICKKCINPKPARTHHCSICNRWVSGNPRCGPFAVVLGQNLDLEFDRTFMRHPSCARQCALYIGTPGPQDRPASSAFSPLVESEIQRDGPG